MPPGRPGCDFSSFHEPPATSIPTHKRGIQPPINAALLSLSLLPAPAGAAITDERGGLVATLMRDAGMRCGTVAEVLESVDPTWRCGVEGVANTFSDLRLCADVLDASCEEGIARGVLVGEDAGGAAGVSVSGAGDQDGDGLQERG